jgi:glycosyltransferase involved in cell wall biosynthesis
MRICILQDILPLHFEGGAQFLGWRTATALAGRGHDVTVVTSQCKDYPRSTMVEGTRLHCLDSVSIGVTGFYGLFAREALDRVVREQQNDFDVVQIRGWRTAALAGQICRQVPLDIPLLGHTSGLGFCYEFETRPRVLWQETDGTQAGKLKRVLTRRFYYLRDIFPMERAVRYLNGFSTVTTRGLCLAHRLYGIPRSKLHLINDGIPSGRFSPPRDEPDGHRLLYVGALVKRKGVDVLIHALQHILRALPDVRLRIVGDGPEMQSLRDLSVRIGVHRAVEFAGVLANEKIPAELQSCNVFVNPSISTVGYETVQIEAMLCGRIVVAPDTSSNRMILIHRRTGLLFRQGNTRSLAKTLVKAFRFDTATLERIGAEARRNALENFSVERMAEMNEQVFKNVISEFRQGAACDV